MDKLINRIERDVKRAQRDIGPLKKADKKFDREIKHAKKIEKSRGKRK